MEKVIISKAEYESLLRESRFLECLNACGVDNWIGYDEASAMLEEEYDEDEYYIDFDIE